MQKSRDTNTADEIEKKIEYLCVRKFPECKSINPNRFRASSVESGYPGGYGWNRNVRTLEEEIYAKAQLFKDELRAKTVDEINLLFDAEKDAENMELHDKSEKERKEREAKELAAAKKVDWDFWRAMRKAQEWQACALSLNIDPDSMKPHPQAWMAGPDSGPLFTSDSFPSDEVQVKFEKRLRLLRANRYDRAIFTQPIAKNSGLSQNEVLLSEFAAWGVSIAWSDMPPELVALAKPVGISPPTYPQPVQPSPVISAEEWDALVEQEEEARKDPAYKAKYDHAMGLYDERDRLLEYLRQDHPYVDIEIRKRLSEIRAELAEIDKAGTEVKASPASDASVATRPAMELTPSERRAQLDITRERGARRRILEKWNEIEMEYGEHADGHQVLRVLKRDKDETVPELKTVQNHLSRLRRERLIP